MRKAGVPIRIVGSFITRPAELSSHSLGFCGRRPRLRSHCLTVMPTCQFEKAPSVLTLR